MSEEKQKNAVFLCKKENCTDTHYHLDPTIVEPEVPPQEILTDRPEVEVIPSGPEPKTFVNTKPEETTP